MLLATFWAGLAGSFYQLLAAVCLQGLAEGVNTSMVHCPQVKVFTSDANSNRLC